MSVITHFVDRRIKMSTAVLTTLKPSTFIIVFHILSHRGDTCVHIIIVTLINSLRHYTNLCYHYTVLQSASLSFSLGRRDAYTSKAVCAVKTMIIIIIRVRACKTGTGHIKPKIRGGQIVRRSKRVGPARRVAAVHGVVRFDGIQRSQYDTDNTRNPTYPRARSSDDDDDDVIAVFEISVYDYTSVRAKTRENGDETCTVRATRVRSRAPRVSLQRNKSLVKYHAIRTEIRSIWMNDTADDTCFQNIVTSFLFLSCWPQR